MTIDQVIKQPVGPRYDEVHAAISDLHLSAGAEAQIYKGQSWYRRAGRWIGRLLFQGENLPEVSDSNPLEDFPDDAPAVAFTETLTERYAERVGKLRLKLLGDCFDPHAVLWQGELGGPPYEEVAVYKMKQIISAHGAVMDAWSKFLDRPNCYLDVYVGNHDLFLVWPRVQHRLARRLCGRDEAKLARLRFIDHQQGFQELDRGILYYHGMNADAQNAIHPDRVILKDQYGIPLKHRVLNEPYGSYLTVKLVHPVKLRNDLIGRLDNHRHIVRNAAIHAWGWVLYALVMTIWSYIYHAFFALWHIRRQSSIRDVIRIVTQAISNEGTDGYARKQLEKPEIDAVVLGHSHEWRHESSPSGTYINTGTWTMVFSLVEPQLELTWRHFRWLERIGKSVHRFLVTREYRFGVQLSKMLAWLTLVGMLTASLISGFPQAGWHLDGLKWLIGLLLAYLVTAGVLRVISAKPKVVSVRRYPFCLVRFYPDKHYDLRLLEFLPAERAFRQCR